MTYSTRIYYDELTIASGLSGETKLVEKRSVIS